jgi:hypothetical protein
MCFSSFALLQAYDDDEPVNPFTIVNDELGAISARMRTAVTSEVPALATAAEYFFKVRSLHPKSNHKVGWFPLRCTSRIQLTREGW